MGELADSCQNRQKTSSPKNTKNTCSKVRQEMNLRVESINVALRIRHTGRWIAGFHLSAL
jgi:hypothetical protein